MVDERITELLIERLIKRIDKANTTFLESIGSSIKKIKKITPTQAQQLIQILKYGGNYDEIVRKIAKLMNMNINDIDTIFSNYAIKDQLFNEKFYRYRNIPFIKYAENEALKRQTMALANITKQSMYNFTRSNAIGYTINGEFYNLRSTYEKLLDEALLNVSQGKETFDSAIRNTLKEIGGSGLKTLDYESGRQIRLDSMVRMHLKDGLRTLHNENQKLYGQEYEADGVEISVHLNPAPDHELVQGHQFSNEEFDKFQNDMDAVDYKGNLFTADYNGYDRRSISQYNCYHYIFNIVLGVSEPTYSDEELQNIIDDNNKGFELNGKHYTNYQGTQMQRTLERNIREQKDIQILAKASGDDKLILESQTKITQLTNKYKELSKKSGLPTKMDRLRVSGYKRIKVDINSKNNINPITKLSNYQTIISKNGVKNLNYDNIFKDYSNFYSSLNKNEVNNVINEMQNYNTRDFVKESNPMGEFINNKLGYDAKPKLITEDEFFVDEFGEKENEYILLDDKHIYRGIKDYNEEKTLEDIYKFKYGKFYAGSGIEGNGTYMTPSHATAIEYALDKDDKFVIKAIINNNAKIIDIKDISEIKRNLFKYGKNIPDEKFRKFTEYVLTDNGYIASLLGFDIIKGQNIVVLNRKSIKVLK